MMTKKNNVQGVEKKLKTTVVLGQFLARLECFLFIFCVFWQINHIHIYLADLSISSACFNFKDSGVFKLISVIMIKIHIVFFGET